MCIEGYKFPSNYSFSSFLPIVLSLIFRGKYFLISILICFLTSGYEHLHFLVFKHCGFPTFSFIIDLLLNANVVK